jgi:hypothetical protein
MLDGEGKQRRSDAGKPLYLTILEWCDRRLSNAFSERAHRASNDPDAPWSLPTPLQWFSCWQLYFPVLRLFGRVSTAINQFRKHNGGTALPNFP